MDKEKDTPKDQGGPPWGHECRLRQGAQGKDFLALV